MSSTQPINNAPEEVLNLEDREDIPTVNDVASLRDGIIKTSKNKAQSPYTILLVGETGVGKSSVLEFIANVIAGNDTDHYDFNILDHSNEAGGSTKESQTNEARIYNLTSKNGVSIRILDTPGLADTRGLQQDEMHKKSIATRIQHHIESINAILILANGTVPRITVGTDYALSTLSALFPKSLARNIAFLFTNVSSPLSWNFVQDTIPPILKDAPQYLLDNPIALQKKYLKTDPSMKDMKEEMHEAVEMAEQKALEMLVYLFDWLDGLEPQPTTEVLSLYECSQNIESKIIHALAQMDQVAHSKMELNEFIQSLRKYSTDMDVFSNYQRTVEFPHWIQVPTTTHNMLCTRSGCYINCHENCELEFSLDPSSLRACPMMGGETCKKCGHSVWDHQHFNVRWEQMIEKEVRINEAMEEEYLKAKNDKERVEVLIASLQKRLDELKQSVEGVITELAQLVGNYAGLSLSGSFSSQVEKAITLLEQSYQGMQEKGIDGEQLRKMKESLEAMKKKLNLLKIAETRTQNEKTG